ncbi:MAG TPA: 4-(cytidine 5'-diphospho)-2-C-methyl-D-erythritol kinase [Stellaceae bacterium]
MTAWRCFAPAKLNLYLHVTGRRADGLHYLDSLVAFADIGDEIQVAPAPVTSLTVTGPFAASLDGAPRDNLVWRAADALASRLGRHDGAAITLVKNLPVASGIGGGSSDAAACLRALAAMWNCPDRYLLMAVAATLGSDVPACLVARPVWLGGIGDEVAPAAPLPACGIILVNPKIPLPTAAVYRVFGGEFSLRRRFNIPSDIFEFSTILSDHDNDLTGAAIGLMPAIGAVLARLARADQCLLARMSGSGATCFALFPDHAAAIAAADTLRAERSNWWVAAATLAGDGAAAKCGRVALLHGDFAEKPYNA